ncbi:MAG: hypothetical protein FWD92_06225 [Methanomassiliicoccaceae archaeon]|nr:hypothetical protein [Methanomassiliicoccaceae archaeon]
MKKVNVKQTEKQSNDSIGPIFKIDYDERNLRELDLRIEAAEIAKLATDTAINGHEVLKYVKHLPVQDIEKMYPAISNLGNPSEIITWSMPGRDHARAIAKKCEFHFTIHSSFVSCKNDKKHYARAKKYNCWSLGCPFCLNNTALRRGAKAEQRIIAFRHLCIRKGIGNFEPRHWVISPPQDWAVQQIKYHDTFLWLRDRIAEELRTAGMLAGSLIFHPWRQKADHWRVGPHFHCVGYGFIDTDLFKRRNNERDSIAIGMDDDEDESEKSKKWIIKLIHSKEKMRSVRHTMAYLFTHAGIGSSERPDREADLDGRFWKLFFPDNQVGGDKVYDDEGNIMYRSIGDLGMERMFSSDNRFVYALMTPPATPIGGQYDNESSVDLPEGFHWNPRLSLMASDEWFEWVKDAYRRDYRSVYYFGGIHIRELRVVERITEERSRSCPKCGDALCRFHGINDVQPEEVKYNHELPVMAFTVDVDRVRRIFRDNGLSHLKEGGSDLDLVMAIPDAYVPDDIKVREEEGV